VRKGNVVVIARLDRLGRPTKDLLTIVGELEGKGVQLEVLEQIFDTSTPEGKLFFTVGAACAEFEREVMRSRTMDGLAASQARGRLGGRKPKLSEKQIAEVTTLYNEQRPVQEIAGLFGVSRPTIFLPRERGECAHVGGNWVTIDGP